MGAAREARESEKTFNNIFTTIRNLAVCVWYPITEDAIEIAEQMKRDLDKMITQMKAEKEAKNGK